MTERKKVALVTGAGMGIGKAIADRLARDGFAIAVNDVSAETAEATAQALRDSGGNAVAVPADVSNQGQAHAMVETAVEQLGRLDVMVCNAGIVQVDPITEIKEADFDKLFAINVKGVIWCAQAAAKQMIAQGCHAGKGQGRNRVGPSADPCGCGEFRVPPGIGRFGLYYRSVGDH